MSGRIMAIDQGTTSTRCMIFDREGCVAGAQREHRQIFPRAGWVEHDPLEILRRTREVIGEAAGGAEAIAAVGIANQRETVVVWDRTTGRPYCNAIVWQDTRTRELCETYARQGGIDRFRETTGLPLATYFSGPKIRWILDNIPGVRAAAECGQAVCGTIDTWLIWNLTGGVDGGELVTDSTNAARTMLMNLRTLRWDDRLLDAFRIPRAMLPRIMSSSQTREGLVMRRDEMLDREIPICGVLGDQQAALVGQTCFRPGEGKNTYGTGCFMLVNTGERVVPSAHGLLTTMGYQFGDSPAVYALEGSVAVTGSLVQWLRDNLGIISAAPEVETLARTVPDNGGVYIVPAFSGLFAPHWRADARGVIAGMTRFTHRGHIARAALEATAYQTNDVLEAMRKDSGLPLASLKVDGGMSANELLMQFQADLCDVPVVRPKISETTALGAAYAAGLAVGYWKDLDAMRQNWRADREWLPSMDAATRARLHGEWMKAVERSFGWA